MQYLSSLNVAGREARPRRQRSSSCLLKYEFLSLINLEVYSYVTMLIALRNPAELLLLLTIASHCLFSQFDFVFTFASDSTVEYCIVRKIFLLNNSAKIFLLNNSAKKSFSKKSFRKNNWLACLTVIERDQLL